MIQKQIFVAPHRRIEEKEEQQHRMEKAFEDLYMTATGCFMCITVLYFSASFFFRKSKA